ncbi:hypothetical protein WJX74_003346 [Apatococcus lobatus]|uniref:Growth arrest-specific protein 8 domain-containing protein n=1 Tax=Apatococcus lobatus TaxID=904363 RepID=A0AAW1RVE1_9CHLO
MPPKAKAGGKAPKAPKEDKKKDGGAAAAAGGVALQLQSFDELNQKIASLEQEKNKEGEYRNYMQLERDKINAFWEITKKDLEDKKAELRNKDREMEELEERHQLEIKVYKQKVKHLLYEHQNSLTSLKADHEMWLKMQAEEASKRELDLQKDKRNLKQESKEQELAHEEVVRSLHMEHAKQASKLRQELEQQARELAAVWERKMKAQWDDAEVRRRAETHEVEERKNAHIAELMRKHEKAFADIKNYYNDITHNNLDLIKALKADTTEMRKREVQNEKLMSEIAQENKRLTEPLTKALKEVETLRGKLGAHEKDQTSLQDTKTKLKQAQKQLKNLEWENEVLQQRQIQAQGERDSLFGRFETSLHEAQQKGNLQIQLLERRITALASSLEQRDAQLAETVLLAGLDPAATQATKLKMEELMTAKNGAIRQLQYDITKVSKAHNDLIRVYEAKLEEFGIPAEEMGFRPLFTHTTAGPAGLVVGA